MATKHDTETSRNYGDVVRVRFSKDENLRLQAVCERENLSKSEVIRRAVRGQIGALPTVSPETRPAIENMSEQLRKAGINLNQAVRAMNEGRVGYEPDLERALVAISDLVRTFRRELREMLVTPRKSPGSGK